MTQEQFRTRVDRAEREVFVISQGEDGYHVRSVRNPANSYLVSDMEGGWLCSCPDFETHAEDPSWFCKHILAVKNKYPERDNYEAEERAAIGSEETAPEEPKPVEPPAQMVIKRSVSPDGRIDSVSIEFSLPVSGASEGGIKFQAERALRLQTEIARQFLSMNDKRPATAEHSQPQRGNGNGSVASARVLDVGVSNGPYGERFFLNVAVGRDRARMFGSAKKIADALKALGENIPPEELGAGMRFNLPCRVTTERSADGRYLNVTQVLPIRTNGEMRYSA
jgi:hypothetical protein